MCCPPQRYCIKLQLRVGKRLFEKLIRRTYAKSLPQASISFPTLDARGNFTE